MKTKVLFLLLIALLSGCDFDDFDDLEFYDDELNSNAPNQVLMLKVDYQTNTFRGGTLLEFSEPAESFTITYEYDEPGDFGSIKLIYKELNEPIFFGDIHWMGLGKMLFPKRITPADRFRVVDTKDYILPHKWENVFEVKGVESDLEKPWGAVQDLVEVRTFLSRNANQTVKFYLYTPSVGEGNADDWYWIIFLKK